MRDYHGRGVLRFFLFLCLFFSAPLARSQGTSFEAPLCPAARAGAPELSYTLTSFETGSLKAGCAVSVVNALKHGFTSATLVPARLFDGRTASSEGMATREEILECLETIWASGMNIVYQPHLESEGIVDPTKPVVWRAMFDFGPDETYEKLMLDPVFEFMGRHRDEIATGRRHVSLVIAAELEHSTTGFAGNWWSVTRHSRQKLELIGLGGKVPIGWNPNWYPMSVMKDQTACENFKTFVGAVDFVAPSFYGDWSRMFAGGATPRGHAQVDDNKSQMMNRLSYYKDARCSVPQINEKAFVIGEFGLGGDPSHAEQANADQLKRPDYAAKRRAVYSNILDWAMNGAQKYQRGKDGDVARAVAVLGQPWINVWTGGAFDPVGVRPNEDTVADPEISKMFNAYKDWRCGGAKRPRLTDSD